MALSSNKIYKLFYYRHNIKNNMHLLIFILYFFQYNLFLIGNKLSKFFLNILSQLNTLLEICQFCLFGHIFKSIKLEDKKINIKCYCFSSEL